MGAIVYWEVKRLKESDDDDDDDADDDDAAESYYVPADADMEGEGAVRGRRPPMQAAASRNPLSSRASSSTRAAAAKAPTPSIRGQPSQDPTKGS